jgi:pimeloyl-ACP methyl ester carboxylesterase
VVIVAGAGDCAASWDPVAARVSTFSRVVTYDRPGVGRSRSGSLPSLDRYVFDLDAVVAATASEGPLVLVGQSLGGLIARQYTLRHRDRVAGLVLLDATPEAVAGDPGVRAGFLISGVVASALRVVAPFGALRLMLHLGAFPLYPELRQYRAAVSAAEYRRWVAAVCRTFSGPAAGRELRSVLPAVDTARRDTEQLLAPHFGDLPLAVLGSRAWGEKWCTMQRDLATRSRRGTFEATGDRSHNIHMSHVDLTEAAVRRVVGELAPIPRPPTEPLEIRSES